MAVDTRKVEDAQKLDDGILKGKPPLVPALWESNRS